MSENQRLADIRGNFIPVPTGQDTYMATLAPTVEMSHDSNPPQPISIQSRQTIEVRLYNPLLEKWGIPSYKTEGSAGLDLVACIEEDVVIPPGGTVFFGSGLAININDPDLVALVAGRSGLYFNHKIRVGNGIGVIDSDYHGEIGILLHNDGFVDYTVQPGERIAQLLFMPVKQVTLNLVLEFSTVTERGTGGFGHTGRHG